METRPISITRTTAQNTPERKTTFATGEAPNLSYVNGNGSTVTAATYQELLTKLLNDETIQWVGDAS